MQCNAIQCNALHIHVVDLVPAPPGVFLPIGGLVVVVVVAVRSVVLDRPSRFQPVPQPADRKVVHDDGIVGDRNRLRRHQPLESHQPLDALSVLKDNHRWERLDLEPDDEKGGLFRVDPDKLAREVPGVGGNPLQFVVHDLAGPELGVEKVDHHVLARGALGQEFVLRDGPELPVAVALVAFHGLVGGLQLAEAFLPDRLQDRGVVVVIEQVVEFVVVVAGFVIIITIIIIIIVVIVGFVVANVPLSMGLALLFLLFLVFYRPRNGFVGGRGTRLGDGGFRLLIIVFLLLLLLLLLFGKQLLARRCVESKPAIELFRQRGWVFLGWFVARLRKKRSKRVEGIREFHAFCPGGGILKARHCLVYYVPYRSIRFV
mmetsp:Transcript_2076/g.5525  ORF Transcript_2076/g.5525 Transcript_2076/m.5525 type:complete len:373 (+) Transcript_2076:296-1414(+)